MIRNRIEFILTNIKGLAIGFSSFLFVLFVCFDGLSQESHDKVKGETVIPGTWDWDIEKNMIGENGQTDIWWRFYKNSKGMLECLNGSKVTIIKKLDYEQIDLPTLTGLNYHKELKIKTAYTPGMILGIITSERNYAKVKIIGFKALHDFAFKNANSLPSDWKEYALKHDNILNYHLVVEWVLYKK